MSTDRELLEMAAKAAGVEVHWCDQLDVGLMDPHIIPHPTPHFKMSKYPHDIWNPLFDDGDAFRLLRQVDYGLLVEDDVAKIMNKLGGCMLFLEIRDADEMTVIRRAITMSAAEKGRRMP